MTKPMDPLAEVVETRVMAGNYLIELVESDEAFARDDWGDDQGAVRIQPGRVGLHSVDELHCPQLRLRSYASPPAESTDPELGRWPVEFRTGVVEIWSGEADLGEVPLQLPETVDGRYVMRVARWRKLTDEQAVFDYTLDYYERNGEPAHDLERFTVDFWPAH